MNKQIPRTEAVEVRSHTRFMFTIDVESRTDGGPQTDIWGRLPYKQHEYGIAMLMDMLDRHQMHATFFLNVYEMAKYGESKLREVAQSITNRGHDVQLHSHPLSMYPYYGMSKAPLAEQILILKKGVDLLKEWTGKNVVAHRAGAFAANLETIQAVSVTGLQADCSLSGGSRIITPLVQQLGASNLIRKVGDIWEIPVTYYDQFCLGPWHSRRILDLEGSSLTEIRHVVRWALKYSLPTVCLLMHSFSLCRNGKPNKRVIRRFAKLLAWLQQQTELRVCTVEEFCFDASVGQMSISSGEAPCTGFWMTWRRAVQSWKEGGWNSLVAAISAMVFLGIVVLLAYIWRIMIMR